MKSLEEYIEHYTALPEKTAIAGLPARTRTGCRMQLHLGLSSYAAYIPSGELSKVDRGSDIVPLGHICVINKTILDFFHDRHK